MTRDEAKEAAKVMEAYANGKEIQCNDNYLGNGEWVTTDGPSFNWEKYAYRIKPEPKYRPFKTKEECWNEMLKHQPFGWIKAPDGDLFCIDRVFFKGITYKHSSCRFEEYLESNYTFIDGTPFGIRED